MSSNNYSHYTYFRYIPFRTRHPRHARRPAPSVPPAGPLQPRHRPAPPSAPGPPAVRPHAPRVPLLRRAAPGHLVRGLRLGRRQPLGAGPAVARPAVCRGAPHLPGDLQDVGGVRGAAAAHPGPHDLRGPPAGGSGRVRGRFRGAAGVREKREARADRDCVLGGRLREEGQAGGVHEGVELFALDQDFCERAGG